MTVAHIINSFLSKVDVAITRRSSLNHLTAERNKSLSNNEKLLRQNSSLEMMESLYSKLDHKLDNIAKELHRHQISSKWEIVDYLMRANKPISHRECPLCKYRGSSDAFCSYKSKCIFGGGELIRHQCPKCDVIFGADKMFQLSETELSTDYEWQYLLYEEGDSTENELRAFYALNPSRDGVYLNFGAGSWSKTVKILRDEGWNVLAYEPHESAAPDHEQTITSKSELAGMKFDGIFSNNVLEHLRYPVRELIFFQSILKPKGKMAHATPCFEYLYEYTRFHLFFFTGRSRELLAQQAGLKIEEYIQDNEFMCIILSFRNERQ